jgi:hypothetical protein
VTYEQALQVSKLLAEQQVDHELHYRYVDSLAPPVHAGVYLQLRFQHVDLGKLQVLADLVAGWGMTLDVHVGQQGHVEVVGPQQHKPLALR